MLKNYQYFFFAKLKNRKLPKFYNKKSKFSHVFLLFQPFFPFFFRIKSPNYTFSYNPYNTKNNPLATYKKITKIFSLPQNYSSSSLKIDAHNYSPFHVGSCAAYRLRLTLDDVFTIDPEHVKVQKVSVKQSSKFLCISCYVV
jgi:hypothetical protein